MTTMVNINIKIFFQSKRFGMNVEKEESVLGTIGRFFFIGMFCCSILAGCSQSPPRQEQGVIPLGDQGTVKDEFAFLRGRQNGFTYKIKTGEGLYSISRRFGITVTDIIQANNIPDVYDIRTGMILFIPQKKGDAEMSPSPTLDVPIETDQKAIPVSGVVRDGFYSSRKDVPLKGITYTTRGDATVTAIRDGTVSFVGERFASFGPSVMITHSRREFAFYGNVGKIMVQLGDRVTKGTVLGVRKDGDPDFQLKVVRDNTFINPEKIIK